MISKLSFVAAVLVFGAARAAAAGDQAFVQSLQVGRESLSPGFARVAKTAADEPQIYGRPQLTGLNAAVAEALKPFNNAATKASFIFLEIRLNLYRALSADAWMKYSKKGSKDTITVGLDELSYAYLPWSAPKFRAKASVGLNVLKHMPQEELNRLGPVADKLVEDFAQSYLQQYGKAAEVSAKVTEKKTDDKGNLVSIKLVLQGTINLARLPGSLKPESVLLTGLKLEFAGNLKGFSLGAQATINPGSSYFQKDQVGLKELLEKLIAKDPQTIKEIQSVLRLVDEYAGILAGKR